MSRDVEGQTEVVDLEFVDRQSVVAMHGPLPCSEAGVVQA